MEDCWLQNETFQECNAPIRLLGHFLTLRLSYFEYLCRMLFFPSLRRIPSCSQGRQLKSKIKQKIKYCFFF